MIPLVFVHGLMGGSAQWSLQSSLANSRPLVMLDLPGFGKNAQLQSIDSIQGYADWVLTELDQQQIEVFDLLGHSMGGMVVQQMIRQAPHRVNKLILYSTGSIGVLPGRFEPIETSMQRARDDGPKPTARRISATWFLHYEESAQYLNCANVVEQASLDAILAGLNAMNDWSGQDYLPNIQSPTLVIWGDGDRTYTWAQTQTLWQAIPHSNLAVVPNCAHAVHMENSTIFNQIVEDFLASSRFRPQPN